MGRNRAFDEGLVLDNAATTFVRAGYEATSIDDLVSAVGIHRGSLYNTFGSKRGLFLKALDRYVESVLVPLIGEPADTVADRLVSESILDLLLVAAIERGQDDAEVAALVRAALDVVQQAAGAAETGDAPPARAVELLGARLYARLAA